MANRDRLRQVYLQEIRMQCRNAQLGATLVDQAMRTNDLDGVFFAINGILAATANISKICWPRGTGSPPRPIATELVVTADSLIADRRVRNSFEHIDERLETWLERHPTGPIAFSTISDSPGSDIVSPEPIGWFRKYNPRTAVLTFQDDELNLQDLIGEIKALSDRVSTALGA